MERLVLANAMASFDYYLLNSRYVRSIRGDWGEVMEIRFPGKEIFIYIDQEQSGFVKAYDTPQGAMTDEFSVSRENLTEVMKSIVEKYRPESWETVEF